MNRPTIIEAAYGTRGRFHTVEEIAPEDTPVGMSWIYDKRQEWQRKGYDRVRVRIWIDFRGRYVTT